MKISVVIPAFNEERLIADTIASIQHWMPGQFEYEILVVDHGSTDQTAALARATGAHVIDGSSMKTIAALRNLGVENSEGDLFVFIDADTSLSQEWSEYFPDTVESLRSHPKQVCGSHPNVPRDSSPFVRYWFEPKAMEAAPTHIGSCHLIIEKGLFHQIGGFPGEMETGEDFTLCLNAKTAGAAIVANPKLLITHHGAPKSLFDFIKSEIWHGRGDWGSLDAILSSKVALLTLMFLSLHLGLVASWIVGVFQPYSSLSLFAAIVGLCVVAAVAKFANHGLVYVAVNSITFYFYFVARSASLFSALRHRGLRKRSRDA